MLHFSRSFLHLLGSFLNEQAGKSHCLQWAAEKEREEGFGEDVLSAGRRFSASRPRCLRTSAPALGMSVLSLYLSWEMCLPSEACKLFTEFATLPAPYPLWLCRFPFCKSAAGGTGLAMAFFFLSLDGKHACTLHGARDGWWGCMECVQWMAIRLCLGNDCYSWKNPTM